MKGVLIDVTKCTGCSRCVAACVESHGLGPERPSVRQSADGLSSRRFSAIERLPEDRFVKKQCLHCLEPGCVGACPAGAIEKTKEGPVVYDPARCMGCRYCMLACPLGIPRYEWDKRLPYMKKCDMCVERQRAGQLPACVEACPNGALAFGERDALLSEADARIAARPDLYEPHVYGHKELGGTCMLYVSDVPLAGLGWPEQVGERSMAGFTLPLISKTPWVAAGVAGVLIGVNAIVRRRMALQAERVRGVAAGAGEEER